MRLLLWWSRISSHLWKRDNKRLIRSPVSFTWFLRVMNETMRCWLLTLLLISESYPCTYVRKNNNNLSRETCITPSQASLNVLLLHLFCCFSNQGEKSRNFGINLALYLFYICGKRDPIAFLSFLNLKRLFLMKLSLCSYGKIESFVVTVINSCN